jgi:hypothetical protein
MKFRKDNWDTVKLEKLCYDIEYGLTAIMDFMVKIG